MENGVRRWLVDISEWNPSHQEFSFILSALPLHEQAAIARFYHFIDRKRALVSRLLQYALLHQLTNLPFDKITIKRTLEGKPYLEHADQVNLETANFNFNTSHDGDYVGIVSDPFYLVGLDIVSLVAPKEANALEFVTSFSSHFTDHEWEDIVGSSGNNCDGVLAQFCRYWCLKEAFIKAIGAGLGFALNRLEFKHSDWANVVVCIDGEETQEWEFSLSQLGRNHWVGTARGHPRYAVESYKRTLRLTTIEEAQSFQAIVPFASSFHLHTVEQLLPTSFRDLYSDYVGNEVLDLGETRGKSDE